MNYYDVLLSKTLGGGGKKPTGSLSITENGTHDVTDYAEAVVNVPSGGGGVPLSDVNFFDYDGSVVASYTKSQFAGLTEMPENPTHTGLTAQGWNWSLADAKTYVNTHGYLDIGQHYITSSGDTEIDIELEDGRVNPHFCSYINGSVEIDWGDESPIESITGTSYNTMIDTPHTYASGGNYTIKIHVVSGGIKLGGAQNRYSYILLDSGFTSQNYKYLYSVREIRLGSNLQLSTAVFKSLIGLRSVTMPKELPFNCANAFQDCKSLSFVTIPNGTYNTTGTDHYFFNSGINRVALPIGFTIGANAFQNCKYLKRVCVPDNAVMSTSAFASAELLEDIVMPSGITNITNGSFNTCLMLKKVFIPIGVTNISAYAFYCCYSIKEYHILPTTPPTLGTYAFYEIANDCVIYVPSESLELYKTTAGWSDYASYMVGE